MWNLALKLLLKMAVLNSLKNQAELFYCRFVNSIRKTLRLSFLIFLLSQVFILGLGLVIYSGFQLMPWDELTKLYLLLGLGAGMIIAPVFLVLLCTSDRVWMKNSPFK